MIMMATTITHAASSTTTSTCTKTTALHCYRTLSRLIRLLPSTKDDDSNLNKNKHKQIISFQSAQEQLRSTYRSNASLTDQIQIQDCLREAGEKIAYLRIITPKPRRNVNSPSSNSSSSSNNSENATNSTGTKRFVYTKDGVVEVGADGNSGGTLRDSKGRVISNWDGKNMDPCSVKMHRQQLKRAGFQNNLHAKGLF